MFQKANKINSLKDSVPASEMGQLKIKGTLIYQLGGI
jgi:hypothetical protein